ncbi:hypothetical protein TREMEDRAFT_62308 [Tremella mesenterica DSM 1558]|uniref:uncharacterized protein n=1 Tax=Tremella mesenterica (strain ATCC 24925 / CBS 8224 / DSM 1558 / NBRC 9311 / NRRL Y-6157 / RJB 2259-6 / UBC 559-6) TaxID=578456 RepID=UPI0003F49BCD|nr:uncharacterized protein TREMEDRAFT_62308 [Tremella mesenterica DSM 1558]EIW69441.1 hypothetical protein TREMEDRAFT_62308 [Tremella mesenterica DSM 1558]
MPDTSGSSQPPLAGPVPTRRSTRRTLKANPETDSANVTAVRPAVTSQAKRSSKKRPSRAQEDLISNRALERANAPKRRKATHAHTHAGSTQTDATMATSTTTPTPVAPKPAPLTSPSPQPAVSTAPSCPGPSQNTPPLTTGLLSKKHKCCSSSVPQLASEDHKPPVSAPQTKEKRAAVFRKRQKSHVPAHGMFRKIAVDEVDPKFLVDRQKLDDHSEAFKVLGSTGNVYTVIIGFLQQCDCPDSAKGNTPCKHVLFVFLKVLKVPENSYHWYQRGLVASELEVIFSAAPPTPNGSVMVPAAVRNKYLEATGDHSRMEEGSSKVDKIIETAPVVRKIQSVGEDCPVCYEEMTEEDDKSGKLVYDEATAGCGKECFKMWAATAKAKGDIVTCVWCRTPWVEQFIAGTGDKGKGVARSVLGYVNMADVVGMSRERDTSSYYQGPISGERMSAWAYRYADD